jgi:hypothetical protein
MKAYMVICLGWRKTRIPLGLSLVSRSTEVVRIAARSRVGTVPTNKVTSKPSSLKVWIGDDKAALVT